MVLKDEMEQLGIREYDSLMRNWKNACAECKIVNWEK